MTLLSLFIDNLLPIFLISLAGFLIGKWLKLDPKPLSQVIFYLLSPCLIFDLITNSSLSGNDMLRMSLFAFVNMLIIGVFTWWISGMLKIDRELRIALIMVTTLMNAGNYGLSLNLFAFGQETLSHASIYFITMVVLTYTLGIAVVSMGKMTLPQSLRGLLKIPAIYAIFLAVISAGLDLEIPTVIERTTSTLADATIPLMLVLLGLQLQKNERTQYTREVILANSIRLVFGPLLALGIGLLFNFQGSTLQAGLIESAMPTAVMTTVLATEYDIHPVFVTSVVFTSTILSPLTITPLLAYLGA